MKLYLFLIMLFFSNVLVAQDADKKKIRIIDTDTKAPVSCSVIKIVNGIDSSLGQNDTKGYITIRCYGSDMIKFIPISKLYFGTPNLICQTIGNQVDLLPKYTVAKISLLISDSSLKNNYGDVSYLYSLLAEKYKMTDSTDAILTSRTLSYINLGKYLGVNNSFYIDSNYLRIKFTPEFESAVTGLQKKRGIPVKKNEMGQILIGKTTFVAIASKKYTIID